MIIEILIFIGGFIFGALVTRNNLQKVNKVVEEAKELAKKAEAELAELKEELKNAKKPATKRGRKPAAKK